MGLRSSPWNILFADRLPASQEVLPQESSGLFVNPEAYAYKDRNQRYLEQLQNSENLTDQQKAERTVRELTAPVLSEKDLMAAQRGIESFPAYQSQQRGVSQLEELYSKAADAPLRTNLAPILGLLGETSGSDYSKYYKPPETPEERRQLILGLANKLQSERGNLTGITKELLSGMKVPRQVTAIDTEGNLSKLVQALDKTKTGEQKIGSTNVPPRAAGKGAGGDPSKLIKTEQWKRASANVAFQKEMKDYLDTFKKYGYEITGEGARLLDQKRRSLNNVVKEAEKYGALQKAEIDLLNKMLGDPTSPMNALIGQFKGGSKAEIAALQDFANTQQAKGENYIQDLRIGFPQFESQIQSLEKRGEKAMGAQKTPQSKAAEILKRRKAAEGK